MTVVRRAMMLTIVLVGAATCTLALAAAASAAPDRVKVGPDLYLQSAAAATEGDRAAERGSSPAPARPEGRIVGGFPTTIADYPWQVAIAYNDAFVRGRRVPAPVLRRHAGRAAGRDHGGPLCL